jgi:hypothetical protein
MLNNDWKMKNKNNYEKQCCVLFQKRIKRSVAGNPMKTAGR